MILTLALAAALEVPCYDVSTKPAKVNTSPKHVQKPTVPVRKRASKKPLYRADREPATEYPCDSPSLLSAALPPEPEPMGEFTPVPGIVSWQTTFEQEVPEVPPTFETRCECGTGGFPSFGGGGTGGGYFVPPIIHQPPVAIPSPVPEPTTLALFGAGLLILASRRKR